MISADMSTADLLKLIEDATAELVRRHGLKPERPCVRATDFYWARHNETLIFAETEHGARWALAYYTGGSDPILDTPEPRWYRSIVVSEVPSTSPDEALVGFELYHSHGNCVYEWFARSRCVNPVSG